MEVNLNENQMTCVIKDLLCIDNKWVYNDSNKNSLTLNFKGNHYNVMARVQEWLNTPKRSYNINLLKDDTETAELLKKVLKDNQPITHRALYEVCQFDLLSEQINIHLNTFQKLNIINITDGVITLI